MSLIESSTQIPSTITLELLPFPGAFAKALEELPPKTSIAIAASASLGLDGTLDCAERAAAAGFSKINLHLPARLVRGPGHLAEVVARAAEVGVDDYFVVGGDVAQRDDLPYPDGFSLLEDIAANHSRFVNRIGITGYPGGHPHPAINERLTEDLHRKQTLEAEFEDGMYIEAQLDFSARAILQWIETTRAAGVALPIRIGLLGAVSLEKAIQAMDFMGGEFGSNEFMEMTHIKPEDFKQGMYIERTISVAQDLAAARADVEGLTIYPLTDVRETMLQYGPVFAAAGRLSSSSY